MIAKYALNQFLKRHRSDSRRAKALSEKKIKRMLRKLVGKDFFHTKPRHHQRVCFLLAAKYNCYFISLDTGLGKTWVAFNLVKLRKQNRRLKRAIFLVPNTTNVGDCLEQARKHTPNLDVVGLDGDKGERMEALGQPSDVAVCTYAGFLHMVCSRVKWKTKRGTKKKKGKKMVIDKAKLKAFASRFNFLVCDESTAFMNKGSLTYRAVAQLAKWCIFRYNLTGTPFGRNPQALWSQFFIVDRGETLGETLGLFRSAFFTESDNFWSGGSTYAFDKKKRKLLHRFIANKSVRYAIEDCLDLPKIVRLKRRVVFPETQWAYYERLKEKIKQSKNRKVVENAFCHLRQVCSGFMAVKNDTDGTRAEIVFPENPKLDVLVEVIREIDPKRKIIVYNEFVMSGKLISDRFKSEGFKFGRLWGGLPGKKKREIVERFKDKNSGMNILVMSSSGAFGLNLQIANYLWFFESTVSPIVRKQIIARIYRDGQKRTPFVGDIVTKGSVEEKILKYLKEGRDLQMSILEGKDML